MTSGTTSETQSQELAVIRRRIAFEQLKNATASLSPDGHDVVLQGLTVNTQQLVLLADTGVLGLRPVLAMTSAPRPGGPAPQGMSADLWHWYETLDCSELLVEQPSEQIAACQWDDSREYALDASVLDRTSVASAGASVSPQGTDQLDIQLTSEGAARLRTLTITLAGSGRQVAVTVDGFVCAALVIKQPIADGRLQITGDFGTGMTQSLAAMLDSGPLPAPLASARGPESIH
ncbi:preprotein translocase subunit SecD [Catenulispora sp. EB89]|uniref:SecDF P1 head subdomain-containing protein n=1 Tax=Catenulispora sp. EB89 TaxID=3156257 RepID=UPI003511E4BD